MRKHSPRAPRRLAVGLLLSASCAGLEPPPARPVLDEKSVRPVLAISRAPIADSPAQEPEVWTLAAVHARILDAHPDLQAARERLAAASAAVAAAQAASWPALSLGYHVLASDQPSLAFAWLLDQERVALGPGFDPTPGTIENWRKEVRLDWSPYEPGRAQRAEAAQAEERASDFELEAAGRGLLHAATETWIALALARSAAEVAHESVAVVEAALRETEQRQIAGAALRADVLRLGARVAAARDAAAQADHAVRVVAASLDALLARPGGAPIEPPADEPLAIAPALPEDLEPLRELALRERRDLRALEQQALAAEAEADAARAQRGPRLDAFASFALDGPDPAFDLELGSSTVGLELRWPFSAATAPRARAAAARARAVQAQAQSLRLRIAREVAQSFSAHLAARESAAHALAAEAAAEEGLRLVLEAHRAGAATVTDLLAAEQAARDARLRSLAARAEILLTRVRLAAAAGVAP